jgi:DNA polymerase III delta prime subunit
MQKEPAAAKSAKAILDYNDRIVRSSDEAIGRIDSFVKFLKGMTAEEIKLIPKKSREDLKQVLSLVIKMSQAASKE